MTRSVPLIVSTISSVVLAYPITAQATVTVEALRALSAGDPDDQTIAALAREEVDTLRLALERTFARAADADSDVARARELAIARRLAGAYAGAWDDSFFVRYVGHFATWSPRERRAKVEADSLRRAGRDALGSVGLSAARALFQSALDRVPDVDSAGRAESHVAVGVGFYYAGQLDSAGAHLERARDLSRTIGDMRTWGNAVGVLASVTRDRGDRASAAELYALASTIRARSGDERGLVADQQNLGLLAWDLGDLAEARRAFEQALTLNQEAGRSRPAAINLTNLADIASLVGDYEGADSLYREALATNRAAGDHALAAVPLHRLGLIALRRGDYPEAGSILAQALEIHDQAGDAIEAVRVRRDLAALQTAVGDLEGALATLRRAERDAASVPEAIALQASLVLAHADLDVQLGQLAEAELDYSRAEQLYRSAGDDAGQGEAHQGRGLLFALRGDTRAALDALELASAAQARAGDRRAQALTQLLIGHVQSESGDTAMARATLTRARDRLGTLGDAVGEAAALVGLGHLARRTGATLAAESLYRLGLERLDGRPAVDVRWQLHLGLGEALRSRSALTAAADELRVAISGLEEVVGGFRSEERRVGFLADKWRAYASLATVERERGDDGAAFLVSERLRARQLRDMLARGRIPARSEVSDREQDLKRRITELTQAIESEMPDRVSLREPGLTSASADVAREALAASQSAYEALLLELEDTDPAYAALVTGEPVSWEATARRLGAGQALLEYLVTDSTTTLFVVTSDTIATVDIDVGRPVLANLVAFVRRSMEVPEGSPASGLWRTPLRRLHEYLIAPAERAGLLRGKRSLVIIPHGGLHFLPFAALIDSGAPGHFLVERYELSRAPSATAWVRLAERDHRTVGAGVLALAPSVESLPASREEVLAIREVYGADATLLVGAAASEAALRSMGPGHAVLHLATYGLLNKHNPLFSYVELAPGGSSADGRLEVHEVFGLPLAGQLVVLSACQTALASGAVADIPSGDDWVGLVQAFLYAGASSVVASLWPVEDRATAVLMQRFYRELAGGQTEALALAEAQRTLLRDSRTAHPFYWAGFVRTGAGS